MRTWQFVVATAGAAGIWFVGFALAARPSAQVQPAAAARTAGAAFKNVTTSSLKELSVDDFITSMGLISRTSALTAPTGIPGRAPNKPTSLSIPRGRRRR